MKGQILDKLKNKTLFAQGKRGVVYTAFLNNKKVAIKEKRFDSHADGAIEKEAYWLKLLNKHGIGPKFIAYENSSLIYEFAEGQYLPAFLESSDKQEILKALRDILLQCRKLDKLGINKLEMTRPVKHVIVTKNIAAKTENNIIKPNNILKPVMIDFERARKTEKPKNVTQFCQFLTLKWTAKVLESKKIFIDKDIMINLAKEYKKMPNEDNFRKILLSLFKK